MNVRYFAAPRPPALRSSTSTWPTAPPSASLLEAILAVERPEPPAGTLPRWPLLTRCSFLLNEVAVRDLAAALKPGDVVDVLPPFAGG